jgi:hypothetical protein
MPRSLASRAFLELRSLAIALIAAWVPAPLDAQATTVTLQGSITASDGAIPQAARIEIRNRETGTVRGTLADTTGSYRALGLAPGSYDIAVRAIGYRRQVREAVHLLVGQRATLDFGLEPGGVELTPTVITAAPAFEVQRTDVSTAVSPEEIENLPLNARNVLNLAAIAPGIRTFGAEGGRSTPSSGALPEREPRFSNFYLDGVEWKGAYVGQVVGGPSTGSMIPQEALREFRVYLNSYDAEYARAASYVISAVTHRGGNELQGSLFSFFQNRGLVAKGAFQATKPEYQRYQVGGNLRGPVVRDRLFFAASYEGHLTDDYIDVVPGRPVEQPGRWDDYVGTFRAPTRHHTALVRLTAPLGAHTVDAIWATRQQSGESSFGFRLAGFPLSHEAGIVGGSRVTSVQLRDTWTRSSLINELSLHFLDLTNGQSMLAPGPTLQYPGLQRGRTNFPFALTDRHIHAVNKTSWALDGFAGSHVIKSGVEVNRVATSVWRPTNSYGAFVFPTDTSTLPSRGTIGVSLLDPGSTRDGYGEVDGWVIGGYLQDHWRPIPTLGITAGVRYDAELNTLNQDFTTPWARDTTLLRIVGENYLNTGDRKADLDNIAPRLAISWDPFGSGRTNVRAGHGVMFDRIPLFGALQERIATNWRSYVFPNPGTSDPAVLRARVAAGGGTPPNLLLFKDRMEAPENHQWSAGVGQQLTDRLAINVDYVSQRVNNAYVTVNTNLPVNGVRPLTGRYGNILLWDDFGDAKSQAVLSSITWDQRPTRLNIAYTLGWAKSEFGESTTGDYPDSAAYTMQASEGDERHRIVISGLTTLPFGLDVSGIVIVASPRPSFAAMGIDVNQNGSSLDDWPEGIRTIRAHGWQHWYRTVDLRLGKSVAMPRGRMAVTAEVFNLFSSANHSEYQATWSQLGFGQPSGDYPRRQGQLGVRYLF